MPEPMPGNSVLSRPASLHSRMAGALMVGIDVPPNHDRRPSDSVNRYVGVPSRPRVG